MTRQEFLQNLTVQLSDQGKLIEAGWVGLQLAAINAEAPPTQLSEMRMAFFAGAQHAFHSIMTILEPGEEPTNNDMNRLPLIDKELKQFIADFEARSLPTSGRA
jgi:hypothetical protein